MSEDKVLNSTEMALLFLHNEDEAHKFIYVASPDCEDYYVKTFSFEKFWGFQIENNDYIKFFEFEITVLYGNNKYYQWGVTNFDKVFFSKNKEVLQQFIHNEFN